MNYVNKTPHWLKVIALLSLVYTSGLAAHAEHDKARYVAVTGNDAGNCDSPSTPCQTVGYAAKKANKGDKILVASGQYQVKSVDELFYLTSDLVPSYGGFSQQDHYKKANPKTNPTYITGVPADYTEQLSLRGFTVIADIKTKNIAESKAFQQKLSQFDAIKQAQQNVTCQNGVAAEFPCHQVDLVAHVPLNQFAGNPSAANDIWGHVDLNTGIEYAVIGLRNGTSVVSLADPANPNIVGHINGLTAIWRDIKVYQYFDHELGIWQAYAYVSTDGAADSITIISLNDLPNTISKVAHANEDSSLHNIYISNVNYSTGVAINNRQPLLHSMGSNRYGGAHRSYDLINPAAPKSVYTPVEATRDDYTHDGTSFVVTDKRVADNCQRFSEAGEAPAECDIFVDFNENEMRLWDQTDKTKLTELGQGIYNNAGYTHSGWWTEDKKYIYVHDELDEQRFGLNTSVIIFDVSDLTTPLFRAKWSGPTRAIDHNGFVRGNRYYMSNYERGMTILDISNPTAPIEAGYFDTFPFSDDDQFNGAWGVYPFLPSGLILASDINSGLYVLKDQTKQVNQGLLQFEQDTLSVVEGQTARLTVNRVGGNNGEISVDYQTLWGSADNNDFTAVTGTLSWADGETASKTIDIPVLDDHVRLEFSEVYFLELYNPQGGATLANSGIAQVTIAGSDGLTSVKFDAARLEVVENQNADKTNLQIPVSRFPMFDTELTATIDINMTQGQQNLASLNQDFELHTTSLYWGIDDQTTKYISIDILNDDLNESAETIVLSFATSENFRVLGNQEFTINILDDDSNTQPVITTGVDMYRTLENEVALNELFTVEDDQANLTYIWTITKNANNASIVDYTSLFTTMELLRYGTYEVKLQVTDPFGATATASITIERYEEDKKSDSGFLTTNQYLTILLTMLCLYRRRQQKLYKYCANN